MKRGCQHDREGSRHSIYRSPRNGNKAPVPRHIEIDTRLTRRICRQLGIRDIG